MSSSSSEEAEDHVDPDGLVGVVSATHPGRTPFHGGGGGVIKGHSPTTLLTMEQGQNAPRTKMRQRLLMRHNACPAGYDNPASHF